MMARNDRFIVVQRPRSPGRIRISELVATSRLCGKSALHLFYNLRGRSGPVHGFSESRCKTHAVDALQQTALLVKQPHSRSTRRAL
jgi:hypothetical protein